MYFNALVLTYLLHRERLCREGEPKGDGRCFQWNGQHHHTDIPQGKQRHLTESFLTVLGGRDKTVMQVHSSR